MAKQRQHPGESTHIHGVEQDQPQGMKSRGQTTKYIITTKPPGKIHPTVPRTLQKAVTANEHNYPYQIRKAEVPQHQTVIRQRYPTVECPVESTHCKEMNFCALLF